MWDWAIMCYLTWYSHMWKSFVCSVSKSTPLSTFKKCLVQTLMCFPLNKCKTFCYLSLQKHTHTKMFLKFTRDPLCVTDELRSLDCYHLFVCKNWTNPSLTSLCCFLLRVKPKWSGPVSAVMNVPLPREVACTKAWCVTMVTCGTAQVVSSVPVTGDRSFAREPSVVVLNARRWARKWFSF